MDNDKFDLITVGRPILADPFWVQKIRDCRDDELRTFTKDFLGKLILQ